MRRIGGHGGVWLAAGLWAVAAPLNIALIAATVAPPPARPAPEGADGFDTHDASQVLEDVPPAEAIPEAAPPALEAGSRSTATRARAQTTVRMVIHKVVPGDGLISVTRGYLGSGSRWREVAEANEIPPPHVIEPGTSLRIPMARSARTEAHLELVPPREPQPVAPAAVPVKDVNPPDARALEPPSEFLRISHPLAEAYPWGILLFAGVAFAGVALGGAVLAVAWAKRRVDPARTLRSFWWGATAGGGACALVAGVATLAAADIARSSVLQFLLAAVAGVSAGTAAWFAAKSTPGAEERDTPSYALAVRFGVSVGWLTASAVAAAAMAGWLSHALLAIRLGA